MTAAIHSMRLFSAAWAAALASARTLSLNAMEVLVIRRF
jgi:hypothetical protein